jgi:hypothetical protein
MVELKSFVMIVLLRNFSNATIFAGCGNPVPFLLRRGRK